MNNTLYDGIRDKKGGYLYVWYRGICNPVHGFAVGKYTHHYAAADSKRQGTAMATAAILTTTESINATEYENRMVIIQANILEVIRRKLIWPETV